LYGKLFKAHQARYGSADSNKLTTSFYDKYEIHAHYPGHAKKALAIGMEAFEALADQFRLRPRERDLVLFAVRNHMQVINSFGKGDDIRAYELLLSRAHKAGFDADDAIDFLLAALFLDVCVGSLPYVDGEFQPNVDIVLQVLRAEEHIAPHRRAQRRFVQEERKKKMLNFALKEAGLDGKALFALLQTPFGPERGRIASEVRNYVLEPHLSVTIPSHTREIEKRVKKARSLFDGKAGSR
jgi:hypothetical protein